MARQLVTIDQAIEARPYLTVRYLRALREKRLVPTYKLGGRVLFDLVELDALAEASRTPARGAA